MIILTQTHSSILSNSPKLVMYSSPNKWTNDPLVQCERFAHTGVPIDSRLQKLRALQSLEVIFNGKQTHTHKHTHTHTHTHAYTHTQFRCMRKFQKRAYTQFRCRDWWPEKVSESCQVRALRKRSGSPSPLTPSSPHLTPSPFPPPPVGVVSTFVEPWEKVAASSHPHPPPLLLGLSALLLNQELPPRVTQIAISTKQEFSLTNYLHYTNFDFTKGGGRGSGRGVVVVA